jgi:hypothetical protein
MMFDTGSAVVRPINKKPPRFTPRGLFALVIAGYGLDITVEVHGSQDGSMLLWRCF